MNNVTMVIPTEREVNYHIFMYTMYSSTAETLRQLASFMRTDLGFKQLEVRGFASHGVLSVDQRRQKRLLIYRVVKHCLHGAAFRDRNYSRRLPDFALCM
jgi:hypothetical protein